MELNLLFYAVIWFVATMLIFLRLLAGENGHQFLENENIPFEVKF